MVIDIALTGPQRLFCLSKKPHPAIIGGLGSGKSEAGIVRLLLLMLENYSRTHKKISTLMTFPTYDLCKLRGMSGAEEILERTGISYHTNKSDYSVHINGIGSILFRSYDKPERIVSFQAAHSICDELDTLARDKAEIVWRKVSERTRQKTFRPNSVGAVTTPDQGYSGFVYHKWVKQNQDGYEIIKAPTTSNPFLPEGYIEQIKSNYDPILAEMYISGEFVSLSRNKVYHFFDRRKHHSDRVLKNEDTVIHVGLDFNVGGCCATVWIIENNNPIAVDEFVSHDTRDFCNKLVSYKMQYRRIVVYPDASGRKSSTNASQSDIDIIVQAGFSYDAPQINPFVRDRINAVNSLLAHDRIGVNTNKCQRLTEALESQGYDKKGEPEKFDEHPSIDDWVDSAGYFINRKFPIIRPSSLAMGGAI